MLGLSTRPFITAYFLGSMEERYRDIDFSMGTTLNGNLRYFSITQLNTYDQLDEIIDDYIPFFEIDTLVGVGTTNKIYVKVMASTLEQFKKVSNSVHYASLNLPSDSVIITESMSKTYDLSIGDSVTVYVGDTNHVYQIVDIIIDGGLFQDNTLFMNKNENLSLFLSALNPVLGALPPNILANIYNQVYFEVKDQVLITEAIHQIESISPYDTLSFEESIDLPAINQLINRSVSVFDLIIVFVFLAIILVMQTTFMLYFDEKKRTFAVIELLGGRKKFSYSIILIEVLFFILISAPLSLLFSNSVISVGLNFIGSSSAYQLSTSSILVSISLASMIFLFTSLYYFYYFSQKSSIEQSKESGVEKEPRTKLALIILLSSTVAYFMFNLLFIKDWLGYNTSLFQSVLSFVIMFSLTYTLIFGISKLSFRGVRFLTFTLHLKVLLSKKSFYQYTSVILICFLCINLLVLTNDHMHRRIDAYHEEFTVDFGLTNFITRYDSTYLEITDMPNVETVDKVGLFENVSFSNQEMSIVSVVSLNPSKIKNYFDLPIDDSSLSLLSRTDVLTILLPTKYKYLHNMSVGDQVQLSISPEFPDETFEIGGFFEKQIGDFAFVNLHLLPAYDSISYNSLLINALGSSEDLKNDLIDTYSKNLVYLIDFQELISTNTNQMQRTTAYMTIILSVLIGCFILAIFNHSILLLGQMQSSYARFSVLGYSKSKMTALLIKESLILYVVIAVSTIVGFILLSNQLVSLVLVFGDYENIHLSSSSLYLGILITFAVYFLTKIIYIHGVRFINTSNVLKSY